MKSSIAQTGNGSLLRANYVSNDGKYSTQTCLTVLEAQIWINTQKAKDQSKMPRYIIVKYADQFYPYGRAPLQASAFDTYTANECNVIKEIYDTKDEGLPDLEKMKDFNPTVGYELVELLESAPTPGDKDYESQR